MTEKKISAFLKDRTAAFTPGPVIFRKGTVERVGDGVVHVKDLPGRKYGELLEFGSGVYGMALELTENGVGAVLLDAEDSVCAGETVKGTGRVAEVPVGEALLGRVIDPIGRPLDERELETDLYYPVERPSPAIMDRRPVDTPLETGILAIDSMIPIGRGQRELIIGDRQTGKTAIAIDTIINQKENYKNGDPVYCIYVAVGQKGSTVANLVKTLEAQGAMDYTIVVSAPASSPAAMQFYAPYAGVAIAEYFRDTGRHALIIYDDLSKQAVAYREVSLILRRPPGREAYPGDIFYLHSRLLERAAKIIKNDDVARQMNDLPDSIKDIVKGGGSITALPIIETQAGDVSAYIPTNVISITDGQIFLETSLFNAGIRPAINVGISVSRVGGNAQIKSMKKVAGTLKLDQAQFREMEAFSKFGAELDAATLAILDKGRKNVELLKQPQYSPMPVEKQVAIIFCGTNGLLSKVPENKVLEFEKQFLDIMTVKHKDVMEQLKAGKIDDDIKAVLKEEALNLSDHFNS